MGKPRLILYDTCNYRDYPVGGQVTSIKIFSDSFHRNIRSIQERFFLWGCHVMPAKLARLKEYPPVEVNTLFWL